MPKQITTCEYKFHPDYGTTRPMYTFEDKEGNAFIARSRMPRRLGYVLTYNRGDKTFAAKEIFDDAHEAKESVAEFSKALGLTLIVLAPMLLPGGAL